MHNCSELDCQNDAVAFGALPGHATRFICALHLGTPPATGFISHDGTLRASYAPIAEYAPEAPEAPPAPLCTHKAHNAKHVRPAVLAYAWPGPHKTERTERDPDAFGPGLACPGCVIEIVAVATRIQFPLELTELP